jgi:hypothetical protein
MPNMNPANTMAVASVELPSGTTKARDQQTS